MLGAGINPRFSWHRLSVKIARMAAQHGYCVLRIDPQGVGDSDGAIEDIEPSALEAFHEAVQRGLFVEDCRTGLNRFVEEYSINEVVVAGLCGGALTGLYLTEENPRIKGLIFIAGPVHLSSLDAALPFQPIYADSVAHSYTGKALNPVAWIRFLTGRSDYNTILFLFKVKLYRFLGIEKRLLDSVGAPDLPQPINDGDQFKGPGFLEEEGGHKHLNPFVPKSFLSFMKRAGEILFINAEMDQATWGFRNYFAPQYLRKDKVYIGKYEVMEIGKANHTFSSQEAQESLMSRIEEWLLLFRGKNKSIVIEK